jgi:hypothetical protein
VDDNGEQKTNLLPLHGIKHRCLGHPDRNLVTILTELFGSLHSVSYVPEEYFSVYNRCYITTARRADIPGPFLGNGWVNMFPQKRIKEQQ